jgi:hypothetical protein
LIVYVTGCAAAPGVRFETEPVCVIVKAALVPTVAVPVPDPVLVKYAIAAAAIPSAATTLSNATIRPFDVVNLRNMREPPLDEDEEV